MSGITADRSRGTARSASNVLAAETIDELVSGLVPASGGRVEILAPFTGETLHLLPHNTAAEVERAAATARSAQRAWARTSPAHRRRVLLRAHDLLLARRELVLDAIQLETGKSRSQAFEELFNAAAATRYAAIAAPRVLASRRRRAGIPLVMQTRVSHRPKGLVGVVTPWNYPPSLTAMDIAPALAAGNAVLQKADDQGALSILATRGAFIDAGLPAELWAVVTGPGPEVGSALVAASDVVAFTGSTATGITVATQAAATLTPVSLELGGKNPVIVLDDVDVERVAVSVAHACFAAAGQLCVSAERVLVHRGIADRFIPALAEAVASVRLGSAFDYSVDVGSLTSAAQLERVRAHVDDAVARGAAVLAGGRPRPDLVPYFYEPTLLTGVTDQMACARDETFGPVASIVIVEDDDAAIATANDTRFGLNASVFSGSVRRARRLAERLQAGTININEGYRATFSAVAAPSGGVKLSGLGRRNGPDGILRYTDTVQIARATGIIRLPRTGAEHARLAGVMLLGLRALRTIRRG